MKTLIVGSGGREHALAWKLAQESEVFCAPGNPGTAEIGQNFAVPVSDHAAISELCRQIEPDLVVVGPEDPLIDGLADRLRAEGFVVFGPGAACAQLEGSKAFAKDQMLLAGVPNSRSGTFTDPGDAIKFARKLYAEGRQAVVKASGPALGKGVIVCSLLEEAEEAINSMMVERDFGDSGRTVVVEERVFGREFSLLTVCSGASRISLPVSQDHKRALDGDRGPNTGGMGTFSPVPWIHADLIAKTEQEVVDPMLRSLQAQGMDYRGMLFSGLMVEDRIPYCLEFNVRFGDPETQSVLRRIGTGFWELLRAAASGEPLVAPEWLNHAAMTVVVASGGYPGSYRKGVEIELPTQIPAGVEVFHAGTKRESGTLVTNGGRVFGVSAVGESLAEARKIAYEVANLIEFEGKFFRKDIGTA
jgi:phosphoribosylamine---glycine ligase